MSNQSIGAVRGAIDVIDLAAGEVAAVLRYAMQPGIGFQKMEPVRCSRVSEHPETPSHGLTVPPASRIIAELGLSTTP